MKTPQTTPEKFISHIQREYNRRQPWLNPPPANYGRKDSANWNNSVIRRAQKHGVRVPGIEAISSDCKRKTVFSLYGISSFKLDKYTEELFTSNANKRGQELNKEIDRIMKPLKGIESGNESIEYVDFRTGQPKQGKAGQTFIQSPRAFQMVDGQTRRGFSGVYDYKAGTELIELKSTSAEDLFKPVTLKVKAQIATYLKGNPKLTGAFVIYVPRDLTDLNWKDSGTFRTYYMDQEEAVTLWNEKIAGNLVTLIARLNKVNGDPVKFYELIEELPECNDPFCCPLARRFIENNDVASDWTFTPKEKK